MGERRHRGWRARTLGLAVVALVVAGGASACSSTSRDSAGTAAAPQSNGAASSTGSADAPAASGTPAAQGASLNADALGQVAPPADRPVISTASLTVETDDVAGTKPRVLGIVSAKKGYLFADQTSYGTEATSTLTIKVPPAVFSETIDDLGRLGKLRSQEVSSEDVTDQVIDLASRITAAEGSLARTGELLARATALTEIRQLEDEFARRQVDLEKLRGQQKTLEARVDFATIVLTLHGADDATPALAAGETADPPGFADGWSGGLAVAGTVGNVALAALGALLPFIPLAIVAYALLRVVRWRQERGDDGPATPAPAEG